MGLLPCHHGIANFLERHVTLTVANAMVEQWTQQLLRHYRRAEFPPSSHSRRFREHVPLARECHKHSAPKEPESFPVVKYLRRFLPKRQTNPDLTPLTPLARSTSRLFRNGRPHRKTDARAGEDWLHWIDGKGRVITRRAYFVSRKQENGHVQVRTIYWQIV